MATNHGNGNDAMRSEPRSAGRSDLRTDARTEQRSEPAKGNSQRAESPGSGKSPSKRGFAAMDTATQRMIASKGGQAAHQKGTAHEFDSEEARRAGQKGGEAVSRDREHMAEIGRKGGESRQSASRLARQGAKEEKR
jgi:general stress protein YciG